MVVRNLTRGHTLAGKVLPANTFVRRLLGLMFRRSLAGGEGLLIEPCRAVHSHFMRFPIDVLFLDRSRRVVHVIRAMQPWRQSPVVREASAVLELAAGAAAGTEPGDLLEFGP